MSLILSFGDEVHAIRKNDHIIKRKKRAISTEALSRILKGKLNNYFAGTEVTTPAPTVLPPSRIANLIPSFNATG